MSGRTLSPILLFIPIVNIYWFYTLLKSFYKITNTPNYLLAQVTLFGLCTHIVPIFIFYINPTGALFPWWLGYLLLIIILPVAGQHIINTYLKNSSADNKLS